MKLLTCHVSIVLLCLSSSTLPAEQIKFDVFLFHDKIGETRITHTSNADGSETYVLDSHSKAKILWMNKDVTSHIEEVYKNNKLISSAFKETENGEVKKWNNVKLEDDKYIVDGYKGKRSFRQPPTFSVLSIYFKDLNSTKQVFDETEADFFEFTKTGNDTWEFKSDGTRNVYHVQNGRVQTAEFHVPLATVTIVRTN